MIDDCSGGCPSLHLTLHPLYTLSVLLSLRHLSTSLVLLTRNYPEWVKNEEY
jgi:hypothetical protein